MAPLPVVLVLAFLGCAVLWTLWDGRRLRRELGALEAFATELDEDN